MAKKNNTNNLYCPIHNFSSSVRIFDGASINGECGCSMIIMLNFDHSDYRKEVARETTPLFNCLVYGEF